MTLLINTNGGGGGPTGSGNANEVTFWGGAGSVIGDADFIFDPATNSLTVPVIGFGSSGTPSVSLFLSTANTPDCLVLTTPSASEVLNICQEGDKAYDWKVPLANNPLLVVHSRTQARNQFAYFGVGDVAGNPARLLIAASGGDDADGTAQNADGFKILVISGYGGSGGGHAGDIDITGGSALFGNSNGASINVTPGTKTGAGTDGKINLNGPTTVNSLTGILVGNGASAATALTNTAWTNFTPTVTLVGGAGNTVPVFTTNSGRYRRIGDVVWAEVLLDGDGGDEGAGTGVVNIDLPVAASADAFNEAFSCGKIYDGTGANGYYIALGKVSASATTIALSKFQGNSVSDLIGNNFTTPASGRTIRLSFHYPV